MELFVLPWNRVGSRVEKVSNKAAADGCSGKSKPPLRLRGGWGELQLDEVKPPELQWKEERNQSVPMHT